MSQPLPRSQAWCHSPCKTWPVRDRRLGARGHQELWHGEASTLLPVRRQRQTQEQAQQQSERTEISTPLSLHAHISCIRSYCSGLLRIQHLEVHNHCLVLFFLSGNVIKQFPVIKNVTVSDRDEVCPEVQLSVHNTQRTPAKQALVSASRQSDCRQDRHAIPCSSIPQDYASFCRRSFLPPCVTTSTATQPERQTPPNNSPCLKGKIIYYTNTRYSESPRLDY